MYYVEISHNKGDTYYVRIEWHKILRKKSHSSFLPDISNVNMLVYVPIFFFVLHCWNYITYSSLKHDWYKLIVFNGKGYELLLDKCYWKFSS